MVAKIMAFGCQAIDIASLELIDVTKQFDY
jgi:hypothetical protein